VVVIRFLLFADCLFVSTGVLFFFFVCLTTWIKGVDTDSHIKAREVIVVTFMSEKAVVCSVSQKGIRQEKPVRERESWQLLRMHVGFVFSFDSRL